MENNINPNCRLSLNITAEKVRKCFNENEELKTAPALSETVELLKTGKLPSKMIQAFSLRPDILNSFFLGFSNVLYPGGKLERSIKEVIIMKVSDKNQCSF